MIAAGSLFTSCVTNTEPQGIKDIREAKANYLDALANLRAADAEKVKAEAAYQTAQIAVVEAEAALKQAEADIAKALADAAQLGVEYLDARIQMDLEERKAQAEITALEKQKELAEAQDELRKALANIAAEAQLLTPKEQEVVNAYYTAYDWFITKQKAVFDAEKDLWLAANEESSKPMNMDKKKANYEKQIVAAQKVIADREATIEEYQSKSEADKLTYGIWKEEYDTYVDSVKYLEFQQAQINKDRSYFTTEVEPAFQSFLAALKKAQTSVNNAVNAVGFKMDFTGKNAFALPKQDITTGSVVKAFGEAVELIGGNADNFVEIDDAGKLAVKANDPDEIADLIFGTDDATDYSLDGIIDALQREMVVTDQYVKDTTGIGALVAFTLADYKATKDTLVNQKLAGYKPYVDAKAAYAAVQKVSDTKKAAAIQALKDLVASVNAAQKNQKTRTNHDISDKHIESLEIALVNYGVAIYDYFGKTVRDSVSIIAYDEETGDRILNAKRALKDIKTTDFVPKKRGTQYRTIFSQENDAEAAQYAAYNVVLNAIKGNEVNYNYFLVPDEYDADNIKEFNKVFDKGWGIGTHDGKSAKAVWYECLTKDKKTDFYLTSDDTKTFSYAGLADAQAKQDQKKEDFYKNIYAHFWGLEYEALEFDKGYLKDSLVVNFNEKTYTEPFVLPDFTKEPGFFTAKSSSKVKGTIDWSKVHLNPNSELDIISENLTQTTQNGYTTDNIKVEGEKVIDGWTLYAKVLATAQFENEAKYYVENKAALEKLAAIVKNVGDEYAAASEKVEGKQAIADSLVTEYVGKEVIDYCVGKGKIKKATELWKNSTLKALYVVDYANTDQESITDPEHGWLYYDEFDLCGYQLEAAEEFLGEDYAARIYDWRVKEQQINDDTQYCNTLKGYLSTYVQALYKYKEGQITSGNPDEVYQYLQTVWTSMINGLRADITVQEEIIETAKHALAKIEAGFDDQQVTIAEKEVVLAKAQAALEVAEANLKVAEAAYKAVLAAHGITE